MRSGHLRKMTWADGQNHENEGPHSLPPRIPFWHENATAACTLAAAVKAARESLPMRDDRVIRRPHACMAIEPDRPTDRSGQ